MNGALGALFLAACGAALLFGAWHGHKSGEIRAGRSGFRPYRPTRQANPSAFYFYLVLYSAIGAVCVVWAILILLGLAQPIPLR